MVEVIISVGKVSKVPTRSGVVVAETVTRLVGEADGVAENTITGVQVGLAVAVGLSVAVPETVWVGLIVPVAVIVGVIVVVVVKVACCRLFPAWGSRLASENGAE